MEDFWEIIPNDLKMLDIIYIYTDIYIYMHTYYSKFCVNMLIYHQCLVGEFW